MIKLIGKLTIFILALNLFMLFTFADAAPTVDLNGPSLLPKAEVFTTPRSGNFIAGATFEVPIYIDTKGNNINTINVKLRFDSSHLLIVNPSGGKSIFGIWVEPPTYDNKAGTASLVGVIPGGIVTSSGLIATITFKAIAPGEANVSVTDYSSANLNDGLGSDVKLSFSGSTYSIIPKTPEGVTVFSDTHPFQDHWYNNNSPIIKWSDPAGLEGYSTVLDVNPGTIPPITINTNNSQISYQNIEDGVWYFHVRANVKGVWGNASHFQIKIDTNPPAKFKPDVNILKDTNGIKKYLLSFITTDALSSVDHYEVGNIDQSSGKVASPVFIQTESPYLVPNTNSNSIRVIIRAFDSAGNVRESYIDLYPGFTLMQAIKKYGFYLLILIIILLLLELILHYLFGHHIIDHIRKAYQIFKNIYVKNDSVHNEHTVFIPTEEVKQIPFTNTFSNTDNNSENIIVSDQNNLIK